MHFGCTDVILLRGGHRHVLATCGDLKGGENRNTSIIIMCLNHSTVYKSCSFWLKCIV